MEITAIASQNVDSLSNVLFNNVTIPGNCSILYREGSGLVKLRGLATTQCRARFRVTFNGNVAIPTGGTVGPINVAISLDGEAIPESIMITTPAAVLEYQNISSTVLVDIPKNCCSSLAIKNIGDNAILVQNANLIVERVA